MDTVNKVYFNKTQFENGEMDKFIHQLNTMSYGKGSDLFQVLITPEGLGAYTVNFIQFPWSGEYGGSFEFVDEDEKVVREYRLPDNSIVYLESDEEFDRYLDHWFSDHPDSEVNESEIDELAESIKQEEAERISAEDVDKILSEVNK